MDIINEAYLINVHRYCESYGNNSKQARKFETDHSKLGGYNIGAYQNYY